MAHKPNPVETTYLIPPLLRIILNILRVSHIWGVGGFNIRGRELFTALLKLDGRIRVGASKKQRVTEEIGHTTGHSTFWKCHMVLAAPCCS